MINSLGDGGAERMLFKLCDSFDKKLYDITVITILDGDKYREPLISLGIDVIKIGDRGWLKNTKRSFKNSDVVLSWLYISDFLSYVFSKIWKVNKFGWNLRHGNLNLRDNSFMTNLFSRMNARLSNNVDFIISCSSNNILVHERIGYKKDFIKYIPNGFEPNLLFKSNIDDSLRSKYDIPDDKIICCTLARWNMQKGYEYLLKSISKIDNDKFVFLLGGTNIDNDNSDLVSLLEELNIYSKVILLGQVENVREILSMSDIYISPSIGEGFPNVLGEAMLCECYCIGTDVGQTREILGSENQIVPSKDIDSLKRAIELSGNLNLAEIGNRNRLRIIENYSIESISEKYVDVMFS